MICPKCGFEQDSGEECMCCGVIFAKLGGGFPTAPPASPEPGEFFSPPPIPAPPEVVPPEAGPPPQPVFANKYGLPDVYDGPAPPGPGGADAPTEPYRPAPRIAPIPAFSAFSIVGKSLRIFTGNLIPFLAIALIALTPMLVTMYLVATGLTEINPESVENFAPFKRLLILVGAAVLAAMAGTAVATGGTTLGVALHLDKREVEIERCLRFGLATLLPVVGVAFLQGLAVGLGLLLCVFPGFIMLSTYLVAIPVVVQERTGVIEALRRSNELTSGYRWTIFGVLFMIGGLNTGLDRLLLVVFGSDPVNTNYLVTSSVLDVGFTGLQATATALIYYQLRVIREGAVVGQMAAEISRR